jgi:hypothetical protein
MLLLLPLLTCQGVLLAAAPSCMHQAARWARCPRSFQAFTDAVTLDLAAPG